jgi:hypothetical protein
MEVMMDMVVEVMVTVVDVGTIMVAVIMLVPLEWIIMMEDKVLKWLVKVMHAAGRDRGAQHGHGFGHGVYHH